MSYSFCVYFSCNSMPCSGCSTLHWVNPNLKKKITWGTVFKGKHCSRCMKQPPLHTTINIQNCTEAIEWRRVSCWYSRFWSSHNFPIVWYQTNNICDMPLRLFLVGGFGNPVDVEQGDVKVQFMFIHGPRKTFNWPETEDSCYVPIKNFVRYLLLPQQLDKLIR